MNEARQYRPIGRVYFVEFLDGCGYLWEHNIVVPADADVTLVLEILSRAYPGRRVRSLKEGPPIHHGSVGRQEYGDKPEGE